MPEWLQAVGLRRAHAHRDVAGLCQLLSSNTVPLLLRGCVWGSVPHETGWPLGHMAVEPYPGMPGGI